MFTIGAQPGVRFIDRGRICLLEPVQWTDSTGIYSVPLGFISDGGTIASFLWAFLFHPYSGIALPCFILHDYEIVQKVRPHCEVHKRLYQTLKYRGVGEFRARAVYLGVLIGGPKW